MGGPLISEDTADQVVMINNAIERGEFGPCQLLVCSHPKYDVKFPNAGGLKHVVFYQPGKKVERVEHGSITSTHYRQKA